MECSLHVVFDCVSETSHRFSRCPHTLLACNCMYYLLPIVPSLLSVFVFTGRFVTVDQVVSLSETQRTEQIPDTASSPGPDTGVHSAASSGQFTCGRGAGERSPVLWYSKFKILRTAGDVSQKSTCSMGDVVYDKNTFQPTQ